MLYSAAAEVSSPKLIIDVKPLHIKCANEMLVIPLPFCALGDNTNYSRT